MAIVRSTTRERKWRAWSGDLEQLQRIAKRFEELAQARQQAMVSQVSWTSALAEEQIRPADDGQLYESYVRESGLEISVAIMESGDVARGSSIEVFPEVDYRNVQNVRMVFGHGDEFLELCFSTAAVDTTPVKLAVSSKDIGWAKLAFATLSDEVQTGVPRWARLKGERINGVLALTMGSVVLGVGLAAVRQANVSLPRWSWPLVVILIVMAIAFTLPSLSDRLFPSFEVLPVGSRPTGNRVLIWLLGACVTNLIALAIGIYVNYVS